MYTRTYHLSFANISSSSTEEIKCRETDIYVPFRLKSVEVSDGTYCIINNDDKEENEVYDEKIQDLSRQQFVRFTHSNVDPDYIHKVKIIMHIDHHTSPGNTNTKTLSSFFVIAAIFVSAVATFLFYFLGRV